MGIIRITDFGGEVPRVSVRALAGNSAQTNLNLLATSTEFRPLLDDSTVAAAPAGAKTLYRLSRNAGGGLITSDGTGWIAETADKSYVKGQLNDDATERTLVTFNDGTQAPRVIDATGQNRLLGVPAPAIKPTLTLEAGEEFTLEEAAQYAAGTVVPGIVEATFLSLVDTENATRVNGGTPVAGPYNLRGLAVASFPTSQRGFTEPWNLLASAPATAAVAAKLNDPQLGGVTVGGNILISIFALPYWGHINNLASLQTRLRALEGPVDGAQLFDENAIATLAVTLQKHFDPNGDDLRPTRTALDEAVAAFKAAFDFNLTPLPTKPVEPTRPTGPEFALDGDGAVVGRNPPWVAYDTAYSAYLTAVAAYTKAENNQESEKAARVAIMVAAQAEATSIVQSIEAMYAGKKRSLEALVIDEVNKRGIVKSDVNPTGLFEVSPDRIIDTRFYIVTLVTDWGEESAPSPVSDAIEVDQNDAVLIARPTIPSGRFIQKWRIYRSNVGTESAAFQFVEELMVGSTSYKDEVKAESLGEVCPSFTWAEPPYRADNQSSATIKPIKGADPYLRGIVGMPNGVNVGFIDNFLAFCEPYIPYAYPVQYQITTEYPIVGLGVFGQTLFVGTLKNPYFVSGSDSASMSAQKLESDQACASRRSIVALGGGVMYASPDGICLATGAGVEVVTYALFSREDWQKLNPASIVASGFEGVYYFSYTGNGGGTYALDTVARKLTRVAMQATAMFADPITDGLFYTEGGSVKRAFATGRRTATWRGPKAVFALQQPMAWVQVDGDQTPAAPAVVRWYGDGVLRHTATFTGTTPQRLPPGRWLEHEVEVESKARLTKVILAGSTQELQAQ